MHKSHALSSACCLVFALSLVGCLRDESLDTNRDPLANAGEDQELEFSGEPVTVTLNGSKSRDLDGKIVGYDWRLAGPKSADAGVPDGGDSAGGAASSGAGAAIEVDKVAKPKLELGQGSYTFTLWVRDDHGAISRPDTVTIKIGGDPVEECVAGAYEQIDDTCRQCLCTQSESCQMAVPTCGKDCWGLIGCIAVNCPTFTMDMDIACVGTNCGQFVAGGQTGAMAAGSCVSPCSAECTPSITTILTGG